MECDTDSLYIAFARETIDESVKPEMGERWKVEKWKWFSSEEKKCKLNFEGNLIPFAQYDKRTPGKFKPEFVGEGILCLDSKVYHVWGTDKEGQEITKTSCKGVQKKRNEVLKLYFLDVIETQNPCKFEDAGFIRNEEGTIDTYTQEKRGCHTYTQEKKVLSDGVSTTHIDI